MQVQNFNPIQFNFYNNIKKAPNNINMPNDCVSFKGNTVPKTEIMKQAESFGLDVYALFQNGNSTRDAIRTLAKKNIPNIRIKSISTLDKTIGKNGARYNAYLLPSYGENCKLKSLALYVNEGNSDIQKIGSAAHEYTHALQRFQNDDYMGIAPLVDNNLYRARALNSFGSYTFNSLEQYLKIGEIFDKTVKISETEGKDLRSAFIEASGFKDEKEFKKACKRAFMKNYDAIKSDISRREEYSYLPFIDDPLKLKRTVKNLCVSRANCEKEAYAVQRNVISAIDKNALTNENKVNPILYELMAEALS